MRRFPDRHIRYCSVLTPWPWEIFSELHQLQLRLAHRLHGHLRPKKRTSEFKCEGSVPPPPQAVSAREPASTVTGRFQGGMVVLLLTHRQHWLPKGGLVDWMVMVIAVVVVMASEPEVYVKLKSVLRRCVTTLSTLTRQLHVHLQPRYRCRVSRAQPETTAIRSC